MTIVHIVAFKSTLPPSSEQEKKLISAFEALATECVKADTKKPYITSLKCGRQCSPEGMTKGMELIFVLEFENFEDRDYYLDHDPAHIDFKNRVPTEFKVDDAAVLDFEVVLHIVGLKTDLVPFSKAEQDYINSASALATQCVKPDTKKPYIKSMKGGRQNNEEGVDKGMQITFVAEFETFADRHYYVNEDPAVEKFRTEVLSKIMSWT